MKKAKFFVMLTISLMCCNIVASASGFKGQTEIGEEELSEEDSLQNDIWESLDMINEHLQETVGASKKIYSVYNVSYNMDADNYDYYYVEYDYDDDSYVEDSAIVLVDKKTGEGICYSYNQDEEEYLNIVNDLSYDEFIEYDPENLKPKFKAGGEEAVKRCLAEFAVALKGHLFNPDSFYLREASVRYIGNYSGSIQLMLTISGQNKLGGSAISSYMVAISDYNYGADETIYKEGDGFYEAFMSLPEDTQEFDVDEIENLMVEFE